ITLVECGRDLLLEDRIERLCVGPVLRAIVARVRLPLDQPAVVAAESFGPPSVADRQVRRAVDRRLHAPRAALSERLARMVQPDVTALHQEVRDVEVVVIDEGDAAAELRIERTLV